jgi:hypothetical protein
MVSRLFESPCRLEAENLLLRHQLTIALRQAPPRLRLRSSDRALLIWITRLWPNLRGMAQVVRGDYPAVASCGLQSLLALEISKQGRAAEN